MAIAPVPVPAMPGAMEALTGQMAGMTADQAYNTFMDQRYQGGDDLQIGYTVKTGDTPAISGNTNNTIASNTNPDPVDAWHDYVENESTGVSDVTGGVVSGSSVSSIALSIIEKTDLSAEAVVPVAIPLDAAIVATSQALGVSIDAAQLDVETKQKFANSIVQSTGMIYDKAKNLVLAWKDKLGNILFPKAVIDEVDNVIKEEGIGGDSGAYLPPGVTLSPEPRPYPVPLTGSITFERGGSYNGRTLEVLGGVVAAWKTGDYNSARVLVASDQKNQLCARLVRADGTVENYIASAGPYTYNDKPVYYSFPVFNFGNTEANKALLPTISDAGVGNYTGAWTALYGTHSAGGYPEGTSKSEATSYTPSTLPSTGSIVTDDGGRIPTVAINIPDNPYDATGSAIDPVSPTDDENAGVIYPGLPKEVPDTTNPDAEPREESSPIPLPIPDTKASNPAIPLVDSTVVDSALVDALVDSLADTLDPQPGQSSGIIPVPQLPGITDPTTGERVFPSIIPESGSGFIHVYNPTPDEFVAFGSWLWVTYADATIEKILNNPFDGVIGAHELYATPNRGGRDNIRSAFLVCPTSAALVPNRYTEIDCGTVIVPEFYGNYLDYSPYSQAYIYLPFIGINEVSIDDIVGHAVNIRYRVDSYSGSCIAMIFVAKDGYQNLCYQFAGSCSVEVPMAGGSQAAIKAGMMQAEAYARAAMTQSIGNLIGGVGSALMGNLGGALSNAGGILGNYANAKAGVEAARVANKSSVQHSGQFGSSHGAMGEKIPFIIIRNPVQVKVVNYNNDYGYPAHKRVIIGGCTGYLRVREVNVISAHATDAEKAAIEMLLKNGVYIS